MKINNPKKLIAIVCTVIAVFNFVFALFPSYAFELFNSNTTLFKIYHIIVPSINLSFPDFLRFRLFRFRDGVQLNYFQLVFYMLMLLAVILFIFRGYKESRLLAFCISLFMLSHVMYAFANLLSLVIYSKEMNMKIVPWLLVYAVIDSAWAWFFWFMLKKIKEELPLFTRAYETDGNITYSYDLASNWQRFFHLIVDRIVCLLLLSPILFYLFRRLESVRFDRDPMGELSLIVLISAMMFVYYLLFEGLLGSTPAKLLTGTRVCDENGNKPSFGAICIRTFSRLVPFEAFSCFGRGWHDQWSDTYVLRQENKGIKGGYYFLLIPFIVFIIVATNFGFDAYEQYKRDVAKREFYEQKTATLSAHWKHISINDFVQLKKKEETYNSRAFYLKVEELKPDSIVFTKLFDDYKNHKIEPIEIKEIYLHDEQVHERLAIHQKEVANLFAKSFADYDKRKGASLLIDGEAFEIEDIFNLSGPEIRNNDNHSVYEKDESLQFYFDNYGEAAEVVSVKSTNVKQQWSLDKVKVSAAGEVGYAGFREPSKILLSCKGYKDGTPYKVEIILRSYVNGAIHKYIVEGEDLERRIYEVFE